MIFLLLPSTQIMEGMAACSACPEESPSLRHAPERLREGPLEHPPHHAHHDAAQLLAGVCNGVTQHPKRKAAVSRHHLLICQFAVGVGGVVFSLNAQTQQPVDPADLFLRVEHGRHRPRPAARVGRGGRRRGPGFAVRLCCAACNPQTLGKFKN